MKKLAWIPLLLLLGAAVPATAEESVEGRFKARRDDGRVQLQLRYSERGGRSQWSFTVWPDEIRELGKDRFEMVREAGTFSFTGERSGSFVFTADPDFVRGLESRGYGDPGARRLFELASLDLTLGYVDEMEALGFGGDLRRLTEMKIHGVDGKYVRALAEVGFDDLSGRQVVEMKIHGVRPSFVREMAELGYDDLSARKVVEMHIHGVDTDGVRELAAAGLEDVSSRELIELEIHGVRPSFVRELVELGYHDLSARQVVEMRIHGVDADDVRELAELGYRDLSVRQLVEMKIHGVSPSFVRRLAEEGYTDLSARELVDMKIHGGPRRGGP